MEPVLIFGNPQSVLKFTRDKWAVKACPAEALAKEETAQPYHQGALRALASSYFPMVGRVSPLTAHFWLPRGSLALNKQISPPFNHTRW